jgi:hypothetical protein
VVTTAWVGGARGLEQHGRQLPHAGAGGPRADAREAHHNFEVYRREVGLPEPGN